MSSSTTHPGGTALPACLRFPMAELNQRFHARGRYYELEGGQNPAHACRDVLEISRLPVTGARCESLVPTPSVQPTDCDAIFVMMNPGGSAPLQAAEATHWKSAQLVPTE